MFCLHKNDLVIISFYIAILIKLYNTFKTVYLNIDV